MSLVLEYGVWCYGVFWYKRYNLILAVQRRKKAVLVMHVL